MGGITVNMVDYNNTWKLVNDSIKNNINKPNIEEILVMEEASKNTTSKIGST